MKKGYIAVIGLGAIGVPLANALYKKNKDDFILLADEAHIQRLRKCEIHINGEVFSPTVIEKKSLLDKPIRIVFVCVKNYSLHSVCTYLSQIMDESTIVIPLQNGIYSHEYMREKFPDNVVMEAFVQGPNTILEKDGYWYQNSGEYYIWNRQTGVSAICGRGMCYFT